MLKAGPTKSISVDLDLLTVEFCQEMGCDIHSGMPNKSKLAELGCMRFYKSLMTLLI